MSNLSYAVEVAQTGVLQEFIQTAKLSYCEELPFNHTIIESAQHLMIYTTTQRRLAK